MKNIYKILLLFLLVSCSDELVIPESNIPSPIVGVNYYQLDQYDFDGKSSKHEMFNSYVTEKDVNSNSAARVLGVHTTMSNGLWTDSNVWSGGVPVNGTNNNTIEISHEVEGVTINFNNNTNINIRNGGILVLESLDLNNNVNVNVESGGVLLVRGDITGKNNISVANNGVIAVGGDYDTKNGGVINNNNENGFYVCGENDTNVNSNPEKNCSDLENDYPNYYAILLGSPLPIELLYQSARIFDDHILIEYETASEINSDYVVVNWSEDGTNWFPIDTIRSNNKPSYYSTKHYFK